MVPKNWGGQVSSGTAFPSFVRTRHSHVRSAAVDECNTTTLRTSILACNVVSRLQSAG